ncbi:MAG: hypothetical protein ACE366_25390 [Bradymonadia bacterium]
MNRIAALIIALGLCISGPAAADSDSWFTLGGGAHYSFVQDQVSENPEVGQMHYGLLTRAKILRFVGLEASWQLDHEAGSQADRILSPRYQLGLMLNLVPTKYFTLFGVLGTGAHEAGHLINLNGASTSLFTGGGLEVYLGDHVAVGFDLRFRLPGPYHLKEEVVEERSSEPLEEALQFNVWQANMMVAWYL